MGLTKANQTSFKKGHKFLGDLTKPNYFKKGVASWSKGKHIKHSGSFQIGRKHLNWKGNNVKYRSLHLWVRKWKPKSLFCERCGNITSKLDASSINHTYKRDISKWRWLCRKCHIKADKEWNGSEIVFK